MLASAPATGVPFVAPLNTTDGPTADVARAGGAARGRRLGRGRRDDLQGPLRPGVDAAGAHHGTGWLVQRRHRGQLRRSIPTQAATLLADAGYTETDADGYLTKDGERLVLRWISDASDIRDQRDVVAEAVQAQAREAGIEITIEQLDTSAYLDRVASSDYEIVAESWGQSDAAVFGSATNPKGIAPNGINYSRYADDDLAAWVPEAGILGRPRAPRRAVPPDPGARERAGVDHPDLHPVVPRRLEGLGLGDRVRPGGLPHRVLRRADHELTPRAGGAADAPPAHPAPTTKEAST